MDAVRIACPRCQKRLKLADRGQLGRKAKCPKCGHRFILDAGNSSEANSPVKSAHTLQEPLVASPSDHTEEPAASQRTDVPNDSRLGVPSEVRIDVGPRDPLERYRTSQGRKRTSPLGLFAVGGSLAVVAVAAIWYLSSGPPANDVPLADDAAPKEVLVGTDAELTMEKLPVAPAEDPLRLYMVPSGARVILHLRPSELWSDDAAMSELRACLTQDVLATIETSLRSLTHRHPTEVDEVLIAWILGARGSEPRIATVVHLCEEERLSDLIEEFGGDPLDERAPARVYLRDDWAVLIRDQRTLAFAPSELAGELADWTEAPNTNTSDGILALLEQTDRNRLLTAVFEPDEVRRHRDQLFPEAMRGVVEHIMAWFDQQAETVAWSIDAGDGLSSEILLRGRTTESSTTVSERAHQEMGALPAEMVRIVRAMNPQRMGFRRIIGRFPAMLEVFRLATLTAVGDRTVRLSTLLPPQAGPNLVLATVLTWDQSTRNRTAIPSGEIDTSRPAPSSLESLADRLQRPVDVEFDRVPLQEALDYIAAEIGIAIEINGDALKDAGYTKNMPQSFDLGTAPAASAIRHIVEQYQQPGKQMVLIVEDANQRVIISTRKFAERNGQTIFEFGE